MNHESRLTNHEPRGAYILIEVLISLFLMTVILMFIGMAIESNLRLVTIERTEVEETQLARAVLEKIARDIRSVVVSVREETLEVDTTAITSLFGLSPFDAELATLLEPAVDVEEEEDAGAVIGSTPGIYGDIKWLQIDTALLPRGETFGSKQVRSGASVQPDRLSPSKTVLYYLGKDTGTITDASDPRYQPERLIGSLGRSSDHTALQYGLFRRQLDRLVSQYIVNEGLELEYEQYDEILAPEVESIEFAYFDPEAGMEGTPGDWIDSWDMDERQTLPQAVRIAVGLRRKRFGTATINQMTGYGTEQPTTVVYSLIVPLPITLDPPPENEEPD